MAVRGLTIEASREGDAAELAPRLRAADVREIEALSKMRPFEALYASYVTADEAWTARLDGRVEAMWGVRGDPLGRVGIVWALGSDTLSAHPKTLIRGMDEYIGAWGRKYRMLTNVVHAENRAAIAALRRMRFEFAPAGRDALRFWKVRDVL